MTKRSELPQRRRHVIVFDEDWEFLLRHYGADTDARLGAGAAVRQIVHARVKQLRELMAQRADARAASGAANADSALASLDGATG